MRPIKKHIPPLVVLLVLLVCTGINPTDLEAQIAKDTAGLRQNQDYLLGGEVEAICYSGFRKGQHPDRGDGAVNPSYEEILEDMNILLACGFNLIRLYDSSENSEMVLNVINENKLDIKVLLGIWLRAELSNHETCEWLHEPIPDQVLQQNKKLNLLEIGKGIELASTYPEIVIAVNVGNEALVDWNDP